eukprot:TRINITY_DN6766_c0_g1_i2.p1 TRINITY_DN6766_c0_g1~~TRINITY_DN6766_c0_g1_i2.p1  ORF type:complete len:432 (+),score=123.47 TRINITY_DN6766_c0_g1_i2:122-1297(+)
MDSGASIVPEDVFARLKEVETELAAERTKTQTLTAEIKQLRQRQEYAQTAAEREEEFHINKMIMQLQKLEKEKENLARQVEVEEEYLTNTLQQKLLQVRKEKIDLENQLEQETEYMVNKLQKQLNNVLHEKSKLEKQLEEESAHNQEKTAQIATLQSEIEKNEELKQQLHAMKTENFVLQQKIELEQERMKQVNSARVQLEYNLEMGSERLFNNLSRDEQSKQDQSRRRTASLPPTSLSVSLSLPTLSFPPPISPPVSMPVSPNAKQLYLQKSPSFPSVPLKEAWVKARKADSEDWQRRFAILSKDGELALHDWKDATSRVDLNAPELINMDRIKSITELNSAPGKEADASLFVVELLEFKNGQDTKHFIGFETSAARRDWIASLRDLIVS